MAEPTSSGASSAARQLLTRFAGVLLLIVGAGCVVVGGQAYFDAWSTARDWQASPEAQDLVRQSAEPTPIFVVDTPVPVTVELQPLPTRVPFVQPLPTAVATPAPNMATAEDITLESSEFRFLDPPEPDAHARVSVTVHNTAAGPSERVLLGIPAAWFEAYRIIGTAPSVSEDRTDDEGLRTFSFPPLAGGQSATYELHVAPVGEDIPPPPLNVLLAGGDAIGTAKPATVAPPPRPGPVMALDIPRLKIKSGVVQARWEPPPFTIGQIRGTANISTGNTVLVGHLTGAAGNVFGHLDQLEPGDKVTATSRGLPYEFVVSRIIHSTNTDTEPMQPVDSEDDARLTLMTCAGVWNPVTRDYSERLWVIAEPPEQAKVTIARVSATATAEAAATGTAVALLPTPTPSPTPFAGEVALAGGLGNTRADLGKAFGAPTGETSAKLVVFRQPGREYHVHFTPDPPRAAMLVILPATRMPFDAAVREVRRFLPRDAEPRLAAPEGNPLFVVERFASAILGSALGTDSGDFSVIYTRDAQGQITKVVLGLGDDIDELLEASRR